MLFAVQMVTATKGRFSSIKSRVMGSTPINSPNAGSIYTCTMNRLHIAAHSALHIYVKGTPPILLESAFDTVSPAASGLGIGHTQTNI